MYIILVAFLFSHSQDAIQQEAIDKYIEIQRGLNPLYKKWGDNNILNDIEKLLDLNCIGNEREYYIKKVKNDLVIIKKMDDINLQLFKNNCEEFLNYALYELVNNDNQKGIEKLHKLEENVWKPFGKYSYVHLWTTRISLGCCVEFLKINDWSNLILCKKEDFENSDWCGNFEISFFLATLCANCENKKDFKNMERYSAKHLSIMNKTIPKNDIYKLGPQGFLIKSLVRQNKIKDALIEFEKIPKKNLYYNERHAAKILLRIYISASDMFDSLGNRDEYKKFHNLALKKIDQIVNGKLLIKQDELKNIQITLATYGDYKILREIERIYNLDKFPIKNGG